MLREESRSFSTFALLALLQAFSPGLLPQSEAKDLTAVLHQGFHFTIGGFGVPGQISSIGSDLPTAMAAAVTSAVTREIPLASVASAFTYRYNPSVDIFERASGVPGPIFSEHALTLGAGQLNFGLGYAFIDFSHLNGTTLDNLRSAGLTNPLYDCPTSPCQKLLSCSFLLATAAQPDHPSGPCDRTHRTLWYH